MTFIIDWWHPDPGMGWIALFWLGAVALIGVLVWLEKRG